MTNTRSSFQRFALTVLASLAAALVAAPAASAVTRYAAPGGTATPAECTNPAGPYCTINTAAAGTGVTGADEVVVLPGHYRESEGDLGPQGYVNSAASTIRGILDQPRPLIEADGLPGATTPNSYGAFFIGGLTLRHVEITTSTANSAFTMVADGGVVEGVIARNTRQEGQPATACAHWHGILRNSVCLTTGPGGIAAGSNVATGGNPNPRLRNVTAVSTGADSYGLDYFYGTFSPPTGPNATVSAKAVIAQGTAQDARARAFNTGTNVTLNLERSNFDTSTTTTSSGGTAAITAPGTGAPNFNVTQPAQLADDGYHQLPGSPTINAGTTDASSGTTDIDGQARQIGLAPADIGADEIGVGTELSVECAPAPVLPGAPTTCTATVTGASADFINGDVTFASNGQGTFGGGGGCIIVSAPGSASCELTYTASAPGAHDITATYSGSSIHEPSRDSVTVNVTAPPKPVTQDPAPTGTAKKKCKRKKKAGKRAATAKKRKCKRKKRPRR